LRNEIFAWRDQASEFDEVGFIELDPLKKTHSNNQLKFNNINKIFNINTSNLILNKIRNTW